MAIEAIEYRHYCHSCNKSAREDKVTRCAHCQLHAFCSEHTGAKHRCLSAPKVSNSFSPDTMIRKFQESGFVLKKGNIVHFTFGDTDTISEDPPQIDDKLARRVKSVVKHHMQKGDICLVVSDKERSPDKSMTLLLRAFPKATCRIDLQLVSPFDLRQMGQDFLRSLQDPTATVRFWKNMRFCPPVDGSLLELPHACLPVPMRDHSASPLPEPEPGAMEEQIRAWAAERELELAASRKADPKREAEPAASEGEASGISDFEELDPDEIGLDGDFVDLAPGPIAPGASKILEGAAFWEASCAVCQGWDFNLTACQKCDLLLHPHCRDKHQGVEPGCCQYIVPKCDDEGIESNWEEIGKYLLTNIVHTPKGCSILHADSRKESWPFYTLEDWEKEHRDTFGQRVASVIRSRAGSLAVAIDGDDPKQQKVILLTPRKL